MSIHRVAKLIVISLVLSMLLTGLAGAAASAQTQISFWHGYSELEAQILEEQIIPRFHELYPDIQVESVRMGYDDLRDRVVTTAAAGGGPDVMRLDIIWTPGFAAAGLLESLERYEGFYDLIDQVYPGPLSTNVYEGVYYGIPLTTNTQVYVYNEELFDQVGVFAPTTWDEFEEVTRHLTQVEGGEVIRYGYDIGGPWAWTLFPWIWSNGGAITDPDITTASGYLDGTRTVEAIETIAQWATSGILAPNIVGGDFDGWGSFVNGMVAARQDGPWFATWLEEHHPDMRVGYSLMPHAQGAESISVVGGENIAIASGSANKEAAWTFTRFMLSYDAQSAMATVGQVPVIHSATDIPEFRESKYYPVYLEQIATAQARTPHPEYGRIEQVVQEAFARAIGGGEGALGALQDAARQVNELLR